MDDHIAIKAENLGKQYRIGTIKQAYGTFRDAFTNMVGRVAGKGGSGKKGYDTIWAVKDVSFEQEVGEVMGIIGSNGAGKSTLLKILSRITVPNEGSVMVRGRVGALLEVGTGFHAELTGRENVFLNGAILGMKRDEIKAKFDQIVDFAQVEKFLDTPVKRYSSGMFVRLAFAVAAHLDTEVLLVDEVLAVGDSAFQKKCLGKMSEVSRTGRTVIFVSHNMGIIQRVCTKVMWIEKGMIKEIGPAEQVCGNYLASNSGFGTGKYEFEDGRDLDAHFLKLEMLDEKGDHTSAFSADQDIRFKVTYKIVEDLNGTNIVLNISDPLGGPLWQLSDLDIYPEYYEGRQKGVYQFECVAPGNVLRPGTYHMMLGAGKQGLAFHHPDPCPFEVTPKGYWRKSYQFFGVTGGPIAEKMSAERPVRIGDE